MAKQIICWQDDFDKQLWHTRALALQAEAESSLKSIKAFANNKLSLTSLQDLKRRTSGLRDLLYDLEDIVDQLLKEGNI